MAKGNCPECDAEIEIEDPVIREVVECPDCGAELEVVKIEGDKIEFSVVEIKGEDWGE
ncbi:MAG: lysine biosynthesis protein LysW [Candidatus Jordarchaeales archaeon]